MRRLPRVLASSIPAGLVTALGIALPASAAPSVAASCTVTGTARTGPPVGLTANTGSYTFDNSIAGGSTDLDFQCVTAFSEGAVVLQDLALTSTGTYQNTVCGTGKADGTNTGITATGLLGYVWVGKDLSYHIDFAAGQGTLQFADPGNPLHPGTSNATGGGEVSITPSDLTVPNGCTDAFIVTGAIALVM